MDRGAYFAKLPCTRVASKMEHFAYVLRLRTNAMSSLPPFIYSAQSLIGTYHGILATVMALI